MPQFQTELQSTDVRIYFSRIFQTLSLFYCEHPRLLLNIQQQSLEQILSPYVLAKLKPTEVKQQLQGFVSIKPHSV